MSINKDVYKDMVDRVSPNSPKLKNCIKAFLIGGTICTLGQCISELLGMLNLSEADINTYTSSILIILTAILTGLGIFDKIARHGGAGTAVPITGFANAMVSPALEHKTEGYILGTAAQMFSIAGPVIVYGTSSSVIYGLIIYIFKLY